MAIASEKELFDTVSTLTGRASTGTLTEAKRRRYFLLSVIGLALVLRLYGISLYPLEGDEYNSIAGAQNINLNWNSILYAVLTHFWMRLGDGEMWLRLPAAIFGIASVPILFKVGERLAGWRCAVACGLIAAVSPFCIYHSQEMRFYSLFIFSTAAFMLAAVKYLETPGAFRARLGLVLTGLLLVLSHFLGVLALCAQSTAAFFANARISRRLRVLVLVVFSSLILVPLIPYVQQKLWAFYATNGVTDFSVPAINGISLVNFAKLALAFYAFVFGYHVYPLRIWFVIPSICLVGFLLIVGLMRLWKKNDWRMMPITYLLAVVAVCFVLDSIGGAVSSVIGPRHVAFAWPIFVVLIGMGLAAFQKRVFYGLLVLIVLMNVGALWLGYQKDWTQGPTPDYRAAAAFAAGWNNSQTALLTASRSAAPIDYYFSKEIRRGDWNAYFQNDQVRSLPSQRLILLSNDWNADRRREIDHAIQKLRENYAFVDGRVDFPLFQYVLERRSPTGNLDQPLSGTARQLDQPYSIYGMEFQDVKLPLTVRVSDLPLKVMGATQLPDTNGQKAASMFLSQPAPANKLILLTNVVADSLPAAGAVIAEATLQDSRGNNQTFQLHLGIDTASWESNCSANSNCITAFRWHKRLAVVGRNSYPGAWRDFEAGMHAVTFNLPTQTEVARVSVRYVAPAGKMYLWAIALG